MSVRHLLAVLVCLGALTVVPSSTAAAATAAPVWLCRPGLSPDPCTPGLTTTRVSLSGQQLGVDHPAATPNPKIDCFYVYPTVSDQKTPLANLQIDPEERSIALYQAARYSQYCRVFAPMYRQVTLAGIGGTTSSADVTVPYGDVRDAWLTYLRDYNHGRGVVLIGHSQGSFVLRQLIASEIDAKPAVRQKLVAAYLLGGNVTVKQGQDVGGDFQHIPACRANKQVGCVVAFSTFDQPPPAEHQVRAHQRRRPRRAVHQPGGPRRRFGRPQPDLAEPAVRPRINDRRRNWPPRPDAPDSHHHLDRGTRTPTPPNARRARRPTCSRSLRSTALRRSTRHPTPRGGCISWTRTSRSAT